MRPHSLDIQHKPAAVFRDVDHSATNATLRGALHYRTCIQLQPVITPHGEELKQNWLLLKIRH